MGDMRRASVHKGMLHVETPLGVVNVHVGLHDRMGRDVVAVEVIPDRYKGERKVLRRGGAGVRLVRALHAKT